jgi:hypothetical protein
VFLRTLAPHGAMSATAIDAAVRRACDRAGVERVGTHRLRHTVATELLGGGAPLTAIAPVLRPTNLSTTAIFAKVDRGTLRTLARPWPVARARRAKRRRDREAARAHSRIGALRDRHHADGWIRAASRERGDFASEI